MQEDSYHHYIPRFLLRNFAIDKYERRFESNIKQQKMKGPKKKKGVKQQKKNKAKVDLLQTYDRKNDQLGVSLISRTYGHKNMYKDLNYNDVMHVEKELSKLENRASNVIQNIIKTSQTESQVVLFRRDLEDLRKFLFVMNYRNSTRWVQFTDKKFDSITGLEVETFMQQNNLQSTREVWLQNIRETMATPHDEVKDNLKIV